MCRWSKKRLRCPTAAVFGDELYPEPFGGVRSQCRRQAARWVRIVQRGKSHQTLRGRWLSPVDSAIRRSPSFSRQLGAVIHSERIEATTMTARIHLIGAMTLALVLGGCAA